jgi:hypothetical protein
MVNQVYDNCHCERHTCKVERHGCIEVGVGTFDEFDGQKQSDVGGFKTGLKTLLEQEKQVIVGLVGSVEWGKAKYCQMH